MFCAFCGSELKDGDLFCGECGNKVSSGQPQAAAPQEQPMMQAQSQVPNQEGLTAPQPRSVASQMSYEDAQLEKPKTNYLPLVIVGVLFVILIILLGLVIYTHSQDKKGATAPEDIAPPQEVVEKVVEPVAEPSGMQETGSGEVQATVPEVVEPKEPVAEPAKEATVYGDWVTTIEMGEAFAQQMGLGDLDLDISFPFDLSLYLGEDGVGRIYMDEESFRDGLSVAMHGISELLFQQMMAEMEMTKEELEEVLGMMGYSSVEDMIMELIEGEDLLGDMDTAQEEFSFTYEDGVIYDTASGSKMEVEVTEDTLVLLSVDGLETLQDMEESFNLVLPVTFVRK